MARQITKEHAKKIVKKLKAKKVRKPGSAHDEYDLYHDGRVVLSFSVRHGSEKDLGHDHLMRQLFLNAFQVKDLANCPLKLSTYIDILKDLELIERTPEEEAALAAEEE